MSLKNWSFRRTLLLSSLVNVVLVILRIMFASNLNYAFLTWNLFLAWMPYLLAIWLGRLIKQKKPGLVLGLVFLAWLVFFPNAPYIVTDFIHLYPRYPVSIWFDLSLIMLTAWNGLVLGYMSLFQVHLILEKKLKHWYSWLSILGILLLSSFGLYLGRFLRWNTWDIITNPFLLFRDVIDQFLSPTSKSAIVGITLVFFIFLTLGYIVFVGIINGDKKAVRSKTSF